MDEYEKNLSNYENVRNSLILLKCSLQKSMNMSKITDAILCIFSYIITLNVTYILSRPTNKT